MNGLELQRRLNARGVPPCIVFITAHDDANSRRQAIEAGALDVLSKPFDAKTMLATPETALTRHDVHRHEL